MSLDEVQELALKHYPLIKQKELIRKSEQYSIQNAFSAHYPKLSLTGQATYQSEVTRIPIELPNMSIDPPSKDQYKMYAELNQSLYNGGRVQKQIQMEKAENAIEGQQIQVQLYQIKERINQLYFGILLIDRQMDQLKLTEKELESAIEKTKGAIENGTALKSSLQLLQAEQLKLEQRKIALKASRQAYADILGLFIDQSLDESTQLTIPENIDTKEEINRPELQLFEAQQKTLNIREGLLNATIQPQLGLFFQAGYGNPALNMLSNEFEPYYIGGVRLNWSLSGFYTLKNNKELLSLTRSKIEAEKETFLFNTTLSMRKQQGEINKLQELLETDKKMVALRKQILHTAKAQLTYGTITTHDYLTELTAEEEAQQALLLHEIQLLLARYNYNTLTGDEPKE